MKTENDSATANTQQPAPAASAPSQSADFRPNRSATTPEGTSVSITIQ